MKPYRARCRNLVLAGTLALLAGCEIHHHRIGGGPIGVGEESMRQYYLFFGLVRLNDVDAQRMAHDLTSYEIVTKVAFTDLVLMPFLLPLTVTTRTVTVER